MTARAAHEDTPRGHIIRATNKAITRAEKHIAAKDPEKAVKAMKANLATTLRWLQIGDKG